MPLPPPPPPSAPALAAAASTGVFGRSELDALRLFLLSNGGPSLRELTAAAQEEGLSPTEAAARADAERVRLVRAAEARRLREARAEERDYQALLRGSGGGAGPGGGGGVAQEVAALRAVAPQASMGAGLLLALVSATLMGYFLGQRLYGAGSSGVRGQLGTQGAPRVTLTHSRSSQKHIPFHQGRRSCARSCAQWARCCLRGCCLCCGWRGAKRRRHAK